MKSFQLSVDGRFEVDPPQLLALEDVRGQERLKLGRLRCSAIPGRAHQPSRALAEKSAGESRLPILTSLTSRMVLFPLWTFSMRRERARHHLSITFHQPSQRPTLRNCPFRS